MNWFAILAEGEAPQGPPILAQLMPIILMFVIFYFLMILPMRRQRRQQQEMLTTLRKNDKVVTNAGILGVVVKIKEEGDGQPAEVVLKVDDESNSRLRVLKSSIANILSRSDETASAS